MPRHNGINILRVFLQGPSAIKRRAALAALAVLLLMVTAATALAKAPCAVEVNGQVAVVAANKAIAKAAVNQLIKEKERNYGEVKLKQNISYKRWGFSSDNVVAAEEIKSILEEKVTFETSAVGISIDGEVNLALRDKAAAKQLLENIKQAYQVDPGYNVSFEQKVELVDLPVSTEQVLSLEDAFQYLQGKSGEAKLYTVQEGDTLWDIAVNFNMEPEALQAANPGFTPEVMQIGQVIKVSGSESPLVKVMASGEKTLQEEIAMPQQIKKNPNLAYGKTRVLQQGEAGLKEVTYRVQAVNGLETGREVVAEKVIKEATPQIVERGSQIMVASRGGISRPPGAITSAYGPRWGRLHKGLDIARSYGSPIQAAQAGKITRASWFGAYGLCVEISHGNGVVTRYAHMSSISVKVGQSVAQGQLIGKVGSTGNSTGPHLHFEKIVKGVAVNPNA